MKQLRFDSEKWQLMHTTPHDTLQMFITHRCNLRCEGCFMMDRLGPTDMDPQDYIDAIDARNPERVTLLGGEPTLHGTIFGMIDFNNRRGIKTTIYTNGRDIDGLGYAAEGGDVEIRVGVHGLATSEKPLLGLKPTDVKFTLVVMLRKDNVNQLNELVAKAEEMFPNVDDIYLSSIRDIAVTDDFWDDTDDTISNREYSEVVQRFVDEYEGRFSHIHISARGMLDSSTDSDKCRFFNIFADGSTKVCPLDISNKEACSKEEHSPCNKADSCLLRKIVLRRVVK